MSARGRLTRFIRVYRPCAPKPDSDFESLVDALLAEHAHKLAEQIRAYKITPSGHPSYDDGKDAGLDLAADLIDPETT